MRARIAALSLVAVNGILFLLLAASPEGRRGSQPQPQGSPKGLQASEGSSVTFIVARVAESQRSAVRLRFSAAGRVGQANIGLLAAESSGDLLKPNEWVSRVVWAQPAPQRGVIQDGAAGELPVDPDKRVAIVVGQARSWIIDRPRDGCGNILPGKGLKVVWPVQIVRPGKPSSRVAVRARQEAGGFLPEFAVLVDRVITGQVTIVLLPGRHYEAYYNFGGGDKGVASPRLVGDQRDSLEGCDDAVALDLRPVLPALYRPQHTWQVVWRELPPDGPLP